MIHPEEPNTMPNALDLATGGTIVLTIALGIPAIFFALIIAEAFATGGAH